MSELVFFLPGHLKPWEEDMSHLVYQPITHMSNLCTATFAQASLRSTFSFSPGTERYFKFGNNNGFIIRVLSKRQPKLGE